MKTKNLISAKLLALMAIIFVIPSCKSHRSAKATSYDQIQMLKENVLLVRLRKSENKLKELKDTKKFKEYKKLQKETAKANQATVDAFAKHFDFCSVYFFDSSDARILSEEGPENITFYDHDFNKVEHKTVANKNYLVAAFAYSYLDVITYRTRDNELHQTAGTNSKPALVLMDKNYVQLSNPFPYRVINTMTTDFKNIAVRLMNDKLQRFHYKSLKKKRRRY